MLIWNIGKLVAADCFQEAAALVDKGLSSDMAAANPNMRSQFLFYQAFIGALRGDQEAIQSAVEESLRLRDIVGGGNLVALTRVMVGAALVRLELWDKAQEVLNKALQVAEALGSNYYIAAALFQRTLMWLARGMHTEATADMQRCLPLMRSHQLSYFYGFTRTTMQCFLQKSVQMGIEGDYAREVARLRLDMVLSENGSSVVPILEIKTLGRLNIAVHKKPLLQAEGLTRAQRDFLVMLLASPGLKLDQELIQAVLWPEAAPAKARSNFDNLLLRVRKSLDQALGAGDAKNYLYLQKGIVCLQNARIDVLEFMSAAKKGFEHFRKKEYWQAENCFLAADQLWHGPFFSDSGLSDRVQIFLDEVTHVYIDMALRWEEILTMTARQATATKILKKAFLHNRSNDALVKRLYHLLLQRKKLAEAKTVLRQYAESLRHDEYSDEEIEEIVADVKMSC